MHPASTIAASPRALLGAILAAASLLAPCSAPLHAQQLALSTSNDLAFSTSNVAASLPSAPEPQTSTPRTTAPDTEHQDGQTKRILGIIPNFRAVNADVHLPPQSVKEKFVTASQDSFDYSSLFVPVAVAAYNYERNNTPEFGKGGVGYARYLWHSAVDQTVENYMVEFFVPVVTHEDTRYYSLERGGFLKRSGYALSRVLITRTDAGGRSFNYSEVIGAGAAAGISNLYYPTRERSFGNTGTQWATSVGIDALGYVVKEFSPEINHALLHGSKIFHLPAAHASN
jgi:hypothetical protein